MEKQFAIFDMDGTLVDSMIFWQRLGREYLRFKGVTENLDEIMEKIKPMTMSQSAELFRETFHLPGKAEEIAGEMNDLMDEHYRQDIPLKDGVKEYLIRLHEQGVKMCVASATAKHLMEACLKRLGVLDLFEFLLSCEEVGYGKHQPDVYFHAAKSLGAGPEKIAVYEDAVYAVKTAKEAGFYVVGVYDQSADKYWDDICALSDETIYDWRKKK